MKDNILFIFTKVGKSKLLFLFFTIFMVYIRMAQNLLNNPESVVFDSHRNRYLNSNWGNSAINQLDSNGVQSYFNTAYLNQYRIDALYFHNDTLFRLPAANLLNETEPMRQEIWFHKVFIFVNCKSAVWTKLCKIKKCC